MIAKEVKVNIRAYLSFKVGKEMIMIEEWQIKIK
jgi:hypothetical protein